MTTKLKEHIESRVRNLYKNLQDQRAEEKSLPMDMSQGASHGTMVNPLTILAKMSETVGKLKELFELSDALAVELSADVMKVRSECKSVY